MTHCSNSWSSFLSFGPPCTADCPDSRWFPFWRVFYEEKLKICLASMTPSCIEKPGFPAPHYILPCNCRSFQTVGSLHLYHSICVCWRPFVTTQPFWKPLLLLLSILPSWRHAAETIFLFTLDSTFRYTGVYTAVAVICRYAVLCSHAVTVSLCPCIQVYTRAYENMTACHHDGIPRYTRRRNGKWSQEGKNWPHNAVGCRLQRWLQMTWRHRHST